MTQGTGGGAEETIFTLTANVSGVIDALVSMSDAMVVSGDDIAALAQKMAATDGAVDTFARSSLSGAQALAELNTQSRTLADEMKVAWFEVDNGVAVMEAVDLGAQGLAESFALVDENMATYMGSTAQAGSATHMFTAELAQAGDECIMLVHGLLEEAVAAGESTSVVSNLMDRLVTLRDALDRTTLSTKATRDEQYLLAERMGILADNAGLEVERINQIVQAEFDWAAAAREAALAIEEEAVAINGPVNAALGGLAARSQEVMDAVNAFSDSFVRGGKTMADFTAQGFEQTQVLAELSRLYLTGAMSMKEMTAAGVDMQVINSIIDKVAGGMTLFEASARAAGSAFLSVGESATSANGSLEQAVRILDLLGRAQDKAALGALTLAQANLDAATATQGLNVPTEEEAAALDMLSLAAERAKAAVFSLADAQIAESEAARSAASATTAEAEATGRVGAAAEGAGAGMGSMVSGIASAINQYFLLVMVAGMVFNALKKVAEEGNTQVHALNLIQGATSATDAQMTHWEAGIARIDQQFGTLATDSTTAFSSIVRAGFQGGDALKVLSADEQLAYNTGSTLKESTDLLVVSMSAYGVHANQASNYTALLYAAWANSGMALSDFNSIIQNNASEAAADGISFANLTSAVALFGKTTGSSNIATRDFQALLAGLTTFTQRSSSEIAKLATGFDAVKFAADDVTGKFLVLAHASEGNVAAFQQMIGGAGDAGRAFANLDISTSQLAKNAKELGFAFDPVKFNALDASGKLLYLAQTVDFNEKAFKSLTSTTVKTNDAFNGLIGPVTQAGAHLAALGTNFDMAAFKSADLGGKLRMLAQTLGDGSPAFLAAIGGAKNLGEAHILMAQKVQTSADQIKQAHEKIQQAQNRTADDAATAAGRVNSAWSHMLGDMGKAFGPFETSFLNGLADLLDNKVPQTIDRGKFATQGAWDNYNTQQAYYQSQGLNLFGQKDTQFYGTDAPSIIRNSAPANYQANLDYFHQMSVASENQKTGVKRDLTNLYGIDLPSVAAQHKEQMYQATLDYLHQSSVAEVHSEPLMTAPVNHLYGIMLPSEIRAQAPSAYQSSLDYFHQQSVAQEKGHQALVKYESNAFGTEMPASVRAAAPQAYTASLDYFHRMSAAFDGEKTGLHKDVQNAFGLDLPSVVAQSKEAAYQKSLDYFHQMGRAADQLPPLIVPPISKVYASSGPAAIKAGAPMAYSESVNYIEQQATAMKVGGQKVTTQTHQTFGVDVPDTISKGKQPADKQTQDMNDGINKIWKKGGGDWNDTVSKALGKIGDLFTALGKFLVGESVVPDMVDAITKSLTGGGVSWNSAVKQDLADIATKFTDFETTSKGIFQTIVDGITSVLTNSLGSMLTSGMNMVGSLADGIRAGMAGAVQAAWDVANAVAGILAHHSPPKTGPMHDDDTWMPNMMTMFTHGITDNAGPLQAAAFHLASTISVPLTGQVPTGTGSPQGTGADAIVSVLWQIYQVLRTQQAHSGMGGGTLSGMQGGMVGGGQRGPSSGRVTLNNLYQALNSFGGTTFELGGRGATAGLGVG